METIRNGSKIESPSSTTAARISVRAASVGDGLLNPRANWPKIVEPAFDHHGEHQDLPAGGNDIAEHFLGEEGGAPKRPKPDHVPDLFDQRRIMRDVNSGRNQANGTRQFVVMYQPAWTKLSNTILRPALSKSTVSLLPSAVATVPVPNFA